MAHRYSRIRSHTSGGTCSSERMGSMPANTPMLMTAATAAIMTKDKNTSLRMRSASCRPKEMDTATPAPIDRPSRMEVRKVISV